MRGTYRAIRRIETSHRNLKPRKRLQRLQEFFNSCDYLRVDSRGVISTRHSPDSVRTLKPSQQSKQQPGDVSNAALLELAQRWRTSLGSADNMGYTFVVLCPGTLLSSKSATLTGHQRVATRSKVLPIKPTYRLLSRSLSCPWLPAEVV